MLRVLGSGGLGVYKQTSLLYKRFLSSAAASVVNPLKQSVADFIIQQQKTLSFEPSSILVVVTPQYSESLIDYIVSSGKDSSIQVVGAAVDSVAFGSQRNGMSVLFADEEIQISEAHALDETFGDSSKRLGRSGADLTNRGIVSARQTWHMTQSFLSLIMGKDTEIVVPLANTLFTSGLQSTLLFNKGNDMAGVLLSSLQIKVPTTSSITSSMLTMDKATPLIKLDTGATEITSCKDNMIKTIDGRAAASYLESCQQLMQYKPQAHSGNGEKKVFASLIDPKSKKENRFEVTAGGGGNWSPRASMLVLEPQARPEPKMGIEFYLAEDVMQITKKDHHSDFLRSNNISVAAAKKALEGESNLEKVVLECAPVIEFEDQGDLITYAEDAALPGVFSLGSEQGFLLNDSKYNVPGEVVQINIE